MCVKWNKTRREKGQKAAEAEDWYREEEAEANPEDDLNDWYKDQLGPMNASGEAGSNVKTQP